MGNGPVTLDLSKATPIVASSSVTLDMSKAQAISAPSAEQPGLFKRLAQSFGIPTTLEELKAAVPASALGFLHPAVLPLKTSWDYLHRVVNAGQGVIQEGTEAGQNIAVGAPVLSQAGKVALAALKGTLESVPIVGPSIQTAGEDWAKGNLAGAAGGLIGVTAQLAGLTGEMRGLASKAGAPSVERGVSRVLQALDVPPGKGGIRAATMASDLDVAKADLGWLQRNQPLKTTGAERFHEMATKVQDYRDLLWEQGHEPGITRNASAPIAIDPVVQAGKDAVTTAGKRINPREAKETETWLDEQIAQPTTLQGADDMVRELNNDLRGKAMDRYGPLQIRARQAVVQALRTEIDNTLATVGEQGVKEVNRRWGALGNIQDRLEERAVQLGRQEAKASPLPDWLHLYTFLHPSAALPATIGGGVRLAGIMRPDAANLLGKGMKELGRSSLEPPPLLGGNK